MHPARPARLLPMVFLAAVSLAGCVAQSPRDPASALLDEAIAAAGGRAALSNVAALHWIGEATVHAGDRTIELGVDTRVVPLTSATSDSWLRDQRTNACNTRRMR